MWIDETNDERMNKWSSEWNQYYNWKKYIFQTINIKSNSKSNRIIIGQQQQQNYG